MKIRRTVATALLIWSLFIGLGVLNAQDADATVNLDWNICGGHSCGTNGGLAPANRVIAWAQHYNYPQAIAVQEMCTLQFSTVLSALAPHGYTGFRVVTHNTYTNPATTCNEHGDAIFFTGTCINSCYQIGYYPDSIQGPERFSGGDKRGFICGIVGQGAGTTSEACSTHLTTTDSIAVSQAQYYRDQIQNTYTAFGIWGTAAGDFNITPAQFPWNSPWQEGDAFYNQPTHGIEKIDHNYFMHPPYCINPPAEVTFDAVSDHRLLASFKISC